MIRALACSLAIVLGAGSAKAETIDIGGTADMSSFCPAGTSDHSGGVAIGGGAASVRLVA